MAKLAIDYEEKLYLALAALRGAGYTPIRVVMDRAARLGPMSVDWTSNANGAPRAFDLELELQAGCKPFIAAIKDNRTFHAPIGARRLARWLASDAGEREPLALIPAYRSTGSMARRPSSAPAI